MKPMMYVYNSDDELLIAIPVELSSPNQNGARTLTKEARGTIIKTGGACRFEIENVYPESDFIVHGTIGNLLGSDIQLENPFLKAQTALAITEFTLLI